MIGALFVVILVGAFSLCYLQLVLSRSRETTQFTDKKRAFYMAEAGLAEAFHALSTGAGGSVGTPELPAIYGNGMFFVEVTELTSGRKLLESTGLCGTGRHTLERVVQPAGTELATLGAFGSDSVSIDDDVTVTGSPDEGGGSRPAKVGSNGDIAVGETSTIDGDATPGVTGLVDLEIDASVTGSTAPRLDAIELRSVPALSLPSSGDLVVLTGVPQTVGSGEHRYGMLGLGDSGELTLVGPMTIVVENLSMRSGARINIDDSLGRVTILVENSINLSPNCVVDTTSGDASGLTLLARGGEDAGAGATPTYTLGANGLLRGFVYAPFAGVELASSFQFFGSIVGKTLTVRNDAQLEIDQDLAASAPLEALGGWEFAAWRVTELPEVPMVALRMDPLMLMRVRGLDPPLSHEAYDLADDAHTEGTYRLANWKDLADWSEHYFDKKTKGAAGAVGATGVSGL